MIKNRDFKVDGLRFHLNDNCRNEFSGKYYVVFWHEGYERWQEIPVTGDTKKECVSIVKYLRENKWYPFT